MKRRRVARRRARYGVICPNCKKKFGDLAHFCNVCGTVLPPPKNPANPVEQAEFDSEYDSNIPNHLGFCGEQGHLHQVVLIEAKFCVVCGKGLSVFSGEEEVH